MKIETTPNPCMAFIINDKNDEIAVYNAVSNRLLFVTEDTVVVKDIKELLSEFYKEPINPVVA